MKRRGLAVLSVLALVLGALLSGPAGASASTSRFQRIGVKGIDPQILPLLIDKSRQLDVMVEMADDPVAVQAANATDNGGSPTKTDRDGWRTQIASHQQPVVNAIKSAGGLVVSEVQDAYNGVHARVSAGSLTSLASMSGVVAIHLVPTYSPALTESVPYVGAPQAWTSSGQTGAGVKIAVIDTGVDFYHADFGGSGSKADYQYGLAHDTTAPAYNADGKTVAFPSAKIPVGWDFAGDAYDASAKASDPASVPHPDANPLDCDSHGTHTASTAAGFGELENGTTYHGPYNPSIYGSTKFAIGPGVAPNATLFIYKVFGCVGTTDVVTEAINRAVQDGADVISMSLGSDFGTSDTPDAKAADNAARAGVIVVASSGNEGTSAYMTGTPASSSRTISVAALDTNATFPGATIKLSSGNVSGLDANNGPLPVSGTLDVLVDAGGNIALGCDASEYSGVTAGDIVVTARGVCPRVDRAKLGQAAGASAVIMVNNGAGLPPFEGPIDGVTIPFIGVGQADGAALLADAGQSVEIDSAGQLANPTYKQLASFTSFGPRFGDSALKPDVTAPGVSIVAAGMGTGTGVLVDSGTSMAAPHVAGIAALVRDANPRWTVNEVKAAIMSTSDTSGTKISGYDPLGAGSGVAQVQNAATTAAFALTRDNLDNLSFGYAGLDSGYVGVKSFTISNKSGHAITYNLAAAFVGSASGARVSVSPSHVTVPARQWRDVTVVLTLSPSAVAALPPADTFAGMGPGGLLSVEGVVTATPTTNGNGVYPLHMPFLLVPRGVSDVDAGPVGPYKVTDGVASASVSLRNRGIHSGTADVYALGLQDKDHTQGLASVRAVGVQSLPGDACGGDATDACMIFAVNNWHQWSNAAAAEFDIAIDTNADGNPDYIVIGIDEGEVLAGSFDGVEAAFTFDAAGNLLAGFTADAPMNSSTIELPALASVMGITPDSPAMAYSITGFDLINGNVDQVPGTALFNPFKPAVSTGQFVSLDRGATAQLPVSVDLAAQQATPALGWMIVSLDNPSRSQAALLGVGKLPNP